MNLPHAELAVLAGRAYSGPQSATVALDVRVDLLPRGDELVVVCPGTHPTDALDWIRDFDWQPRPFPSIGWCHWGFGSGGIAAWETVRPKLPKTGLITYTGHSLGGALAQVLAACHAAADLPPCRVVTFGAPRVAFGFNFRFGALVRAGLEHVEYARAGDPVPDVPMRGLFRHPTRRVGIGVAVPDLIANHDIARYAADLAALNL